MAQSPDHPELVFLEARKTSGAPMYTIGRPDGKPLWVVIHDMEAVESTSCAENTAIYFHNGAGGRSVSSHYTADDSSIVQCVLLKDSAWTVGNRPGNNRGINWELCGFAAQSREQWLDPFGIAMFNRMVPIIKSDAAKYGIPLVKRTIAELRAWVPGITSHNDLGKAFGGTDHTDPGANFPWDYFMALFQGAPPLPPEGKDEMIAFLHDPNLGKWFRWNGVADFAVINTKAALDDQGWIFSGRWGDPAGAGAGPFNPAATGLVGPLLNTAPWVTVYDMDVTWLGYRPGGSGGAAAHHHGGGVTGPVIDD